jgi:hypothetical protein
MKMRAFELPASFATLIYSANRQVSALASVKLILFDPQVIRSLLHSHRDFIQFVLEHKTLLDEIQPRPSGFFTLCEIKLL